MVVLWAVGRVVLCQTRTFKVVPMAQFEANNKEV